MQMADIIQIRRDTSANWVSINPTLAAGEFGYETDSNKYKIGDGTSDWNTISYSLGNLTTFISLSDTPADYAGESGKSAVVNGAEDGIEFINKLNSSGGTISDYGEVANDLGTATATQDIDLSLGNTVIVTISTPTVFTFTTTHANTSLTISLRNAGLDLTWPVVKWAGGTEPAWSALGEDIVTLIKIGSVWYGTAILGVA